MKPRHLIAIGFIVAASFAARAQPTPAKLSAAEQLQMLGANRELLEDLLEQGTNLTSANTPIDRAAECQRSSDRLARELRAALAKSDADRAAEIGDHFEKVVVQGFVPNLEIARKNSKVGSPDYERVRELHLDATAKIRALDAQFPAEGPLATSKRLQSVREKISGANAKLGPPETK